MINIRKQQIEDFDAFTIKSLVFCAGIEGIQYRQRAVLINAYIYGQPLVQIWALQQMDQNAEFFGTTIIVVPGIPLKLFTCSEDTPSIQIQPSN